MIYIQNLDVQVSNTIRAVFEAAAIPSFKHPGTSCGQSIMICTISF